MPWPPLPSPTWLPASREHMMPAVHNGRVSTDPGDLREEIMDIYDIPDWLRERWRAGWRSALDTADERGPGPFGSCYETPGGVKVHVRPGCRCKT
jgi:hypothetical protein